MRSPAEACTEVDRGYWSCDMKGPSGECRSPHGCHCDEIRSCVVEIDNQAATIAALRKRVEALEGALAKAQAAILTADMMDDRYNDAGYLTDQALWHDRAISIIEAAFDGGTDGR